ncbi:hypothetical protein V6N12_003124 [Hibiscus sabdariffa]|uniref:RNase H type-1 domain-containing protein n=1 Tax=Hibiscus sabdariffa TaxID=183260 RepID=A0ABR2EB04_9ROSI
MYRRLSLLWNGVIKSFFKDDAPQVKICISPSFYLCYKLVHLDEIRFLLGVSDSVSGLSREDIVADPSLADKSKTSGQSRFSVMSWTPPPPRVLKSFSRHVGQVPPLLAEILAIKIDLELFSNSAWRNVDRVIVESDSKVVVEWILNPVICTGIFSPLVKEIVSLMGSNPISFRHISRGCNIDADRLAKRGIG